MRFLAGRLRGRLETCAIGRRIWNPNLWRARMDRIRWSLGLGVFENAHPRTRNNYGDCQARNHAKKDYWGASGTPDLGDYAPKFSWNFVLFRQSIPLSLETKKSDLSCGDATQNRQCNSEASPSQNPEKGKSVGLEKVVRLPFTHHAKSGEQKTLNQQMPVRALVDEIVFVFGVITKHFVNREEVLSVSGRKQRRQVRA